MDISVGVIALALFAVPGVIAEKISNALDSDAGNKLSAFKETVNGVLLSLPIVSLAVLLSAIILDIRSAQEYVLLFDDILFVVLFGAYNVFIAIFIGMLKGLYINKFIERTVNKIRKDEGLNELSTKTCWYRFVSEYVPNNEKEEELLKENKLEDSEKAKFIKVIMNGESYTGFQCHYSTGEETSAITLIRPEEIYSKDWFDEKKLFKNEKHRFIDIEKGIVIIDYDTSDYKSAKRANAAKEKQINKAIDEAAATKV